MTEVPAAHTAPGPAPGYDYLLERNLTTFWREIHGPPVKASLDPFANTAAELGFTERAWFTMLTGIGTAVDPDRSLTPAANVDGSDQVHPGVV